MGLSSSTVRVLNWIWKKHRNGGRYFKSRHISADTGLSPHTVTAALSTLTDDGVIEKWRDSGTPLTWEITIDDT
jgi:DNA-binding GntR family transcriptional regulator